MDNPTERFISTKSARARFLFICSRYSFETSYLFCLEAKDLEITCYQNEWFLLKEMRFSADSHNIPEKIHNIVIKSKETNIKSDFIWRPLDFMALVLSKPSFKLLQNIDND